MPTKPLVLEEFLPFRLSLASNLVSRRIAETYEREHGLSMTQWRVMAVVGQHPGLTATELVGRTALDKVAVSRASAALIKRGFVERKATQSDGRRSSLSLTWEGERIYRDVFPRALAMEKVLLEALPKETLDILDEALSRLMKAASQGAAPRNDPKASPR